MVEQWSSVGLTFERLLFDCKYVAVDVGHAVFLKIWSLPFNAVQLHDFTRRKCLLLLVGFVNIGG
jgi:hypothetical protein